MKHFKDISEYYKGELAEREEAAWVDAKIYKGNAAEVLRVIREHGVKRVIEIGCGSGFIPTELPTEVRYLGVDRNPDFLNWAKKKNPNRTFVNEDIRNVTPEWLKKRGYEQFNLACCFAVTKHFGLHEWDNIVKGIMALAPRAVFDVQVAHADIDNGTEFHHTFVTQEHLERVIKEAGHKYLYDVVAFDGSFPEGHMKTKIVVTEKV